MGLTMAAWGCCCYSRSSGQAGILCSAPSRWLRHGGAPGMAWMSRWNGQTEVAAAQSQGRCLCYECVF